MQQADFRIPRQAATLRLLVEDRLRTAIASGHFKPGQRLVERQLCELFGVGRTSIREALRQLEAEQLVVTIPHRGPTVRTVSPEEAEQLYAARALIEGHAARTFAKVATSSEIDGLREALKDVEDAVKRDDRPELIQAKAKFYGVLMKGCRNVFLEQMLAQLGNRIGLLRITSMAPPGRMQRSLAELRDIYKAIAARNPRAAKTACEAHVRNAAKIALAILCEQQAATNGGQPETASHSATR